VVNVDRSPGKQYFDLWVSFPAKPGYVKSLCQPEGRRLRSALLVGVLLQ
jgi:hypothetical protein